MQRDFTRLRQALKDPADGPYALCTMRELFIEALDSFPKERYQVADLLLPPGQPICQRSRRVIDYLIEDLEKSTTVPDDILFLAKACELMLG